MIIFRNDKDEDVKITVQNKDDIPTEIVVASGEDYEVPTEQENQILSWYLNAKKDGNATDGDEAEDKVAENVAVKNDREFDVEVKYTENGEEVVAVVKAGEEISVPEDQVESVTKQIADAVDPEAEDEGETTAEAKQLAEERAKLAEDKAKLVSEKAEMAFTKLCEEGKAVPAQKESYMALATQEDAKVALAEGKTESVSTLLEKFIESAPKHSLMEEEGDDGKTESDDDDVELTDEEQSLTELGVTEEDLKETKKSLKGDK